MSKTVKYGIDLGTTNSAIAQMSSKGPEIIPIGRVNYIPSVVALDKRGDLKVGTDATMPGLQSAKWFKRIMGTTNTIPLSDQESWSPERLSAEVLKALKAAAKLKTGEEVIEVVITVPAMFTQPQCEATNEAARLAGLKAVVLLQEPIAAATAYLTDSRIEGYYIVYDLGGGTFDVSLLRLRAGELNVVDHGGDNYLGGADFDRAIFDWALSQISRKGCDCSKFEKVGAARELLMALCENARVLLSDQEVAFIYLDDFELPIAKIELSRLQLQDLIEHFVSRTIEITRDRLKSLPDGSKSVRSMLLVGGPTQMPYIRHRLVNELDIQLNTDQDPMTVVARGAALHADSILKSPDLERLPSPGFVLFHLSYETVSPDQQTAVAGRVQSPTGFCGELRIASASGDWETGWITLINGAFATEVLLGRKEFSEFFIKLRDLKGVGCECEPASFRIRSGIRSAQPITPYNYGVVLEGGTKVKNIVAQGQTLPASGSEQFRLSKALMAGSPDSIAIYFVEGNSYHSDENTQVGSLQIKGTEISRSLKEGETIDIRIRMDESRSLKATVRVDLLDAEFPVQLRSITDAPNIGDLEASLREARNAISEIGKRVDDAEQDVIVQAERQIEQLEATMERAENGEVGEAERIHKQLSDAKASIRPLRDKYGLKIRHSEILDLIKQAEGLCSQFNDRMGLAKLADLHSDADKSLRLDSEKGLTDILERVREIFWDHYGKTRECWENQIRIMNQRAKFATDSLTYYELVKRAEKALSENDYDGVKIPYFRSLELIPSRERMKNRFEDAALRASQ